MLDLDLERSFWFANASNFLQTFNSDVDFLEKQMVMDYSCLIGIYQFSETQHTSSTQKEDNDGFIRSDIHKNQTRQQLRINDFWIGNDEVFSFGIIDTLTIYNTKKRTASCFKSLVWKKQLLSTVPPDFYALRMKKFIRSKIEEQTKQSSNPENPIENQENL